MTDRIQGNVLVSTTAVDQEVVVAVKVAAGVGAVDEVAATVDQRHQRNRREADLAVAAEPGRVDRGVGTGPKEVDHVLAARTSAADQAAARSPREIDRIVARSRRGVARTVNSGQRRVDREVARSQKEAVLEATMMMIVRRVVLQVRKKREVVLPVVKSRTEADQEVPGVLRRAAPLVAANRNSLVKMTERVAVVRPVLVRKMINVEVVRRVGTKSLTEKLMLRQVLRHVRGAVAVQLVARVIASLLLVKWMIRIASVLQIVMRITRRQEVAADHQVMTRTITRQENRKVVQFVNARAAVGRPVATRRKVVIVPGLQAQRKEAVGQPARIRRRVVDVLNPEARRELEAGQSVRKGRRVVVGLGQEAQRKLVVEAVLTVVVATNAEVVQEIAARPGA